MKLNKTLRRNIGTGLLLVLAAAILAACSSGGPSLDKIREDTAEVVLSWVPKWTKVQDFEVVDRRVLAEDRIEYDVDLKLAFDKNAFDLDTVRYPGTSRDVKEQIEADMKALLPKEKVMLTVLYRETQKDFWELDKKRLKKDLMQSGIMSRTQLFFGGGLNGAFGRPGLGR